MSNRCMVCDIEATKTGRHYGAITCYPCRAFFRRAQVQYIVVLRSKLVRAKREM